jgi:serine/threonine-protein kinase
MVSEKQSEFRNYGRYHIRKELGKGSMGVVYEAFDPAIGRSIALKVLKPELMENEAYMSRFLKEAKAAGALSHPGIVIIYDQGQDHGTVYIVMEYARGETLVDKLKSGPLPAQEVSRLGVQLADALSYAHSKGIVHRDIKPANIILQEGKTVKITDFGIAHIEDPLATLQTQHGEVLGTPAYMSPEQVKGQRIDNRSDLFSLGIVLYELSTGSRPFSGKTMGEIFRSITEENPQEPLQVNPEIPKPLSRTILKCLEKSPQQRYQKAEDLQKDLEKSLDIISPHVPSPKPFSRRRALFFLLGGVLLATGVSLFYPVLQSALKQQPSGTLHIQTRPEHVEVFINDSFKGQSPIKIELSPGKHGVRLQTDQYQEWSAQVRIQPDTVVPLQVALVPVKN